jgi:biotin carboxyl carrier protein
MSNKNNYDITLEGTDGWTLSEKDLHNLDVVRQEDGSFHLLYHGKAYRIEVQEIQDRGKEYHVRIDGHSLVLSVKDPLDQLVSQMGLSSISQQEVKELSAPMPGLVLEVDVAAGDQVAEGDTLLILEAMKMENVIKAPAAGVVAEVLVESGTAVENGQVLVRFE